MIIGLNFNKVLVEKEFIKGKQKVSKIGSKADLTSIEEEKVEVPNKKAFRVSFSFSVSYDPNLAKVLIEGSLLYLDDPKKVSDFLDAWKKKELPEEIRVELMNYILAKCNIQALSLEDDFNLPPHLPMPKIQIKKETSNSKDSSVKTDYAG
jgi:hypothetical protein